jgi:hypothetical protein
MKEKNPILSPKLAFPDTHNKHKHKKQAEQFNMNLNMNDEEMNTAKTVDNILQMTCGITLADEVSKDPNERDEELTAFLSATGTTLPPMQMHEMKDVYQFRAHQIKKEVPRKQRITIWNPLSLLMDPTIDQVNDATLVVEQLKVLSGTDPNHCRILLEWVKDRAEKTFRKILFPSDTTRRDLFYRCLFHMKNFIQIMNEVGANFYDVFPLIKCVHYLSNFLINFDVISNRRRIRKGIRNKVFLCIKNSTTCTLQGRKNIFSII